MPHFRIIYARNEFQSVVGSPPLPLQFEFVGVKWWVVQVSVLYHRLCLTVELIITKYKTKNLFLSELYILLILPNFNKFKCSKR